MENQAKIKEQMVEELERLRQRATELESKLGYKSNEEHDTIIALFHNLPDPVVVVNLEGIITFANDAVEQFTGYSCSELIGSPPEFLNAETNACQITEEIFGCLHRSEIWSGELLQRRKDGSTYLAEFTIFPVFTKTGNPIAYASIQRDISDRKLMENNLRASKEKYMHLVQHAPAGIYEIDFINQRFISVNDVMCHYLGYTREELLSINPFNILSEESKRHFRQRLSNALAGEKVPETAEFKVIGKDNREFWALINVGYIYENQAPSKATVVAHDITEHKKLQAALSQQKKRLEEQLHFSNALNRIAETIIHNEDTQKILDDMAAIIGETIAVDRSLIYDIDFKQHQVKGISEWLNPNTDGITATKDTYNLDVFIDASTYMLEHRKWTESHVDDISPYAANDGSGELLHGLMEIKSGLWFPFAFRNQAYYCLVFNQVSYRRRWREEEINFIHAAATQMEIAIQKISIQNDQRHAEKALRKSKSLYRTIFENTGTATSIAGLDTILSLVNTEFEKLSGYTKKELEGIKSWTSFVLKSDLQRLNNYHHLRMLSPHKAPDKFEFRFVNKAGEVRNVLMTLAQIPGTLMHLSSFLDITEIKHFQQEMSRLERLNLVGQMAAGIGHEVRNPMTTVRGFLQMFRVKPHLAIYKNHFDLMIDELDRANSIITQFLSLAKDKPVDKKIHNLNSIVEMLYPLIEADAYKSGMGFNLQLQEIPDSLLDERLLVFFLGRRT